MRKRKKRRTRAREREENERKSGEEGGREERECVSVRVGGRLMCCSFSLGHAASHETKSKLLRNIALIYAYTCMFLYTRARTHTHAYNTYACIHTHT